MEGLLKTKLSNMLSAMTMAEWRSLQDFIKSGIGGPPGKSLELIDFLIVNFREWQNDRLSRETIFKNLFPGATYNDKKLRYAMTDLSRQAGAFLGAKSLLANEEWSNSFLKQELAVRKADKAFLSEHEIPATKLSDESISDAELYFLRFRNTYTFMNHFLPRQKRTGNNPAGTAASYLDKFYVARKLQLLCEMVNSRNVMSVDYDYFMQDDIVRLLKEGAFTNEPIIGIYFRILMTLTEPDEVSHFDQLRQLLEEKTDGFKRSELSDMYQYLMNYCIRKINTGNTGYVETLFEIYKTVLDRKIIYRGEFLSQWDFKNIVVIGLRAGDHEWVLNFVNKAREVLPEGERENAWTFNKAYYHFATGNYKRAISLLQQVEFTDLYYQLDTRAILLKCYYELHDEETLLYHLAAFRIFLSRNKLISDYQRTIYRNLVKCTNKLVRLSNHPKKREQLLNEVNEIKQIADINWLRRKISELI
jgi:hypothetical protein